MEKKGMDKDEGVSYLVRYWGCMKGEGTEKKL